MQIKPIAEDQIVAANFDKLFKLVTRDESNWRSELLWNFMHCLEKDSFTEMEKQKRKSKRRRKLRANKC